MAKCVNYLLLVAFFSLVALGEPSPKDKATVNQTSTQKQGVCAPRIAFSKDSISVSGIEIPLPKGLNPLKIGTFEYKPQQIQLASESVQILELHRLTLCELLDELPFDSKQRGDILLKIIDDETRTTQLGLVLTKQGPEAFTSWMDSQTKFIKTQIEVDRDTKERNDKIEKKIDELKSFIESNPQKIELVTNAPGEAVMRISGAVNKWSLQQDLPAGDCIMKAGSYLDVSSGDYVMSVFTNRSFSGDIWHQTWMIYDSNNILLKRIGPVHSIRMYPGQPVTEWSGNIYIEPFDLNKVIKLIWHGDC